MGRCLGQSSSQCPKAGQVERKSGGIGDRLNKETNQVVLGCNPENKADALESVLINSQASRAGQWLRLRASTAGSPGSVPGQRTKIARATWRGQREKRHCYKEPSQDSR